MSGFNDPAGVKLLPVSFALREATTDSISELFSRDVEGLEDKDIERIIAWSREQVARQAAANEAGGGKKPSRSILKGPLASNEDLEI